METSEETFGEVGVRSERGVLSCGIDLIADIVREGGTGFEGTGAGGDGETVAMLVLRMAGMTLEPMECDPVTAVERREPCP